MPLLIIFGILTGASIIYVIYAHQLPLYETKVITIAEYSHRQYYTYLATLKPNILYNRTILRPGEGVLYTAIVNCIYITSKYSFVSSPAPMNVTTNTNIKIEIESPEKWVRPLSEDEAIDLLQLGGSQVFEFTVNNTKIKDYVTRIDEEVGVRSTSYNLNIIPTIQCNVIMTASRIEETFTPKLTLSYISSGDKGNYISIEERSQTKDGKITETKKIHFEWVEKHRKMAYASTAATSIFLTGSAILYIRRRPEMPPKKTIEKVIATYKDLITEATEKPPETENTIKMDTIEDLVKTAEILIKPILHTKEEHYHLFFVIDGNTKYQYKAET